jgi:EAL and modified HD-GYP domain-containing signal transduction protein
MLLGLTRLFKWAALLMTTSQTGAAASAISATAVVRGRLMELLAAEVLVPDECDNAFVVGVFSLLETMLGVPMETALATVTLPDSVTQALLNKSGALADFLDLTIACESGDDAVFARTATALGLTSQQINWAHLQALAWAENLTL